MTKEWIERIDTLKYQTFGSSFQTLLADNREKAFEFVFFNYVSEFVQIVNNTFPYGFQRLVIQTVASACSEAISGLEMYVIASVH